MSQQNRRKLKNYLINPTYQLKYVGWLALTGFVLFIFYALNIYFHIKENYSILVELSPMTADAKAQLYRELYALIFKLSCGSIVFVILVMGIGLVMSHRTAGPLYHFKRIFDAIREGNMDARINLRPKDDFLDVAKSFNDMMDKISKKR
jgi:methyl-accepting chemotaxis protein